MTSTVRPPPSEAPLLKVTGLRRFFELPDGREIRVFDKAHFELKIGEYAILRGPSGSGKSTLLHLLALLDFPDEGEIRIHGRAAQDFTEQERCAWRASSLGIVFQACHLRPERSLLENVLLRFRYLPAVPPCAAHTAAMEALDQVGLADRAAQPAGLLSGGEMQRVALARAVASRPSLLLADEPTGHLDEISGEHIRSLFERIHREGASLLIATHDPLITPPHGRAWRCENGQLTVERCGPA